MLGEALEIKCNGVYKKYGLISIWLKLSLRVDYSCVPYAMFRLLVLFASVVYGQDVQSFLLPIFCNSSPEGGLKCMVVYRELSDLCKSQSLFSIFVSL